MTSTELIEKKQKQTQNELLPEEKKMQIENKKKLKEIESFLSEYDRKAETNIIDEFRKKCKSKVDVKIFDMLPLSDYEKEQMLLEIFHTKS